MPRISVLVFGLTTCLVGTSQAATWKIETLDQSGVGKFSSLKVDKTGNVHVAYVVDDGKDSLKYAFWDHVLGRWFIMTVAERASFSSLVLDSKQHPHISYADSGTIIGCKLRYAYWDGTSWKNQAVPLAADTIAYYTSIKLDGSDNPSISFYEYNGPRGTAFRVRCRIVTWNGKYWDVTTIDGENQSGKFNSLGIDVNGYLHLAYANVNTHTAGVRYAYWDGKSWQLEVVDDVNSSHSLVGFSVCMVVDKEGNPHLSYTTYGASPASVKYAVRKGGRWQVQVMEQISRVGYPDRNSIALDDEGRPYLSYYDAGQGTLRMAHQEKGQKWMTETIDSNGSGFTSSLQIDQGTVWISYADEANRGLKVARRAPESALVKGVN